MSDATVDLPESYPRRILLSACGLSPQVVTETLYSLAVQRRPPFYPTEIHLLTTNEGADRARLSLLSANPGWLRRLADDHGLGMIGPDSTQIHILRDAAGHLLNDIRDEADNHAAADAVTELVREFTSDDKAALHLSLAGGRKTMGFYAGYALSLFGRPQDRLSHVLVSAPFESHPDFFYPTLASRVIYTPPPDSRPLDTAAAKVCLAEIPFVRLRPWLPPGLLQSCTSYASAVAAVRATLEPSALLLDHATRRVGNGQTEIELPAAEFAFLAWLARRHRDGLEGVPCPSEGAPEAAHAAAFLLEYEAATHRPEAGERTRAALRNGMEKAFFLEHKARLNRCLRQWFGAAAESLGVHGSGRRPHTVFGLALDPERIQFRTTPTSDDRS